MAKETTKRKTADKPTGPQPMDSAVREQAVGEAKPNRQRTCWALQTLVSEVHELFPETPVEYSNYDGRNTALDVTFDLTVLEPMDRDTLGQLLELLRDSAYNEDRRIKEVITTDDRVLVSMQANPRTQDSRGPFGLGRAFTVLTDSDSWDGGGADDEDGLLLDGGSA